MKNSLLLIFSLFFVLTSWSQCEEVYLKGKVVDTTTIQGYYNLMVINQTSQRGVYGRPNGDFGVYVRPNDVIGFSVKGYDKEFYTVPDNGHCDIEVIIYLKPRLQVYEDIIVHPIKTLEDIKKEREELSQRETRTITGVNILESPITALYERFSRIEKSKRLVAEMEHQDNMNQIVRELLRVYVAYDVISLDEEQFVDFVDFLNMDEHFLKTATDYDLIIFIQGKLDHYKMMHPELFK